MAQAPRLLSAFAATVLLASASVALAKDITLPPSGDNQFCSVTQGIGPVRVTVEYSSPNVHAPDGHDRAGHIWGELVPYGLYDLAYNDCKSCPWRGGANENTPSACRTRSRSRASRCRPAPTDCSSSPARTSGRSSSRRTTCRGVRSGTTRARTSCGSR